MKVAYVFLLIGLCSYAQVTEEDNIKALQESKNITWEANKELSEHKFVNAEANYRKAISKSALNVVAPYNLGNAYYNKKTYSEAFTRYKQAGELTTDKGEKHKAYHNMGNVFMKNKEYEKAVEAYKQALRNNPADDKTRYNLALAKELLKKQEDEKKKDDKNKDEKKKDQDKKEDEKKGDKEEQKKEQEDNKKGDGDKKEQKKEQPNKEGNPNDKQQQKQPRPGQLSPQQVKNLLQAMQNEEKKVQNKIDVKKAKGVKVKNEKDW